MKSDNHVPTFRAGRTSETAGSVSGLWSPGQPSRRVVPLVPPPLCCRLIVPNRGTDSELPSAAELTSLHCPQALAKTLQEVRRLQNFAFYHFTCSLTYTNTPTSCGVAAHATPSSCRLCRKHQELRLQRTLTESLIHVNKNQH